MDPKSPGAASQPPKQGDNSAEGRPPGQDLPLGSEFHVQPCSSGDRSDQVALFEACFGAQDGESVLAWRYDRAPHGDPICLLGRVGPSAVAAYACNARQVGWGELACTVGQTGDVMTHPEARGRGYFSSLDRGAMKFAKERAWPMVFGLPNRNSASIFLERLGWKGVGVWQPWTFVLASGSVAKRERLRAGRLASLLAPWAAYLGRAARTRMQRASGAYRIEEVERFGDWVEPIGKAVATKHTWMVRRDADYLNWRFFDSPHAAFGAFRVLDARGEPKAYGVYQWPLKEDGPPRGAGAGNGVGHLVDLVAVDPDAQAAALEAGLERLAARGAQVVRSHAIRGSAWQKWLQAHAFQAPKAQDEKWVIVHLLNADHPMTKIAMDPTRWFFTDGDRDDELVR